MSGGNVGLAITQILSLMSLSQWGVRQTAELENNMTSVERIMEYVNLEAEEKTKSNDKNGKVQNRWNGQMNGKSNENMDEALEKWPKNGAIEFIDVSLKYSEKGDRMLKSLSVTIDAGEKVAICGRTGAGKSSIVKALFRLAHNTGIIKIGSIDISMIPLNILRKNISIIPQDAVLFSGTMRQNLDPFGKHSDDELWTALEKVCSRDFRYCISL